MKLLLKPKAKKIEKLFNTLSPGSALDLMRCVKQYEKFNGTKNITLKSARSLEKKNLIQKNEMNIWIPTKIGLSML